MKSADDERSGGEGHLQEGNLILGGVFTHVRPVIEGDAGIGRNELGVKTGKGFYEWDGFKIVKERYFSELQIKDSNKMFAIKE